MPNQKKITYLLTGLGALNLKSPIGGSAKGIPHHISTSLPLAAFCRIPWICKNDGNILINQAICSNSGHFTQCTSVTI